MSPSVLSASPSPSIGNTTSVPFYAHSTVAFPTALLASTPGPMLSGLLPPPSNLHAAFEHEDMSPLSGSVTEHTKNFATFTNGGGVSADEDEEDHFDDYVQGDLDYDNDQGDGSGLEIQGEVESRSGVGGMINQVLSGTHPYPTNISGLPQVTLSAERRDRQRISPSLSPVGSRSSERVRTENTGPQQISSRSIIPYSDSQGRHSTSVSSAASSSLASFPRSARAVVGTAEQILNPASYEGMNTRSYGLTILADGSNGSRAFMNPLTGIAREPHSSGSGAATPNGNGSGYGVGLGGVGIPGVYAQYTRSSIAGMEERGGSIDPGSLRSSPFQPPPPSHVASPRSQLHHHPHNTFHPSNSGTENGHPPSHSSRQAYALFPHARGPGTQPQNHLVHNTSYGHALQDFTLKADQRSNDPDLEMNAQMLSEDGIPINSQAYAYGDHTSAPSPGDSLSSVSGSGDVLGFGSTSQEHGLQFGTASHEALQQEDDADEEPLYVNAKQYHRILKRRAARARLEELNQLIRQRKPYLHESRHKHACRRPRGPGGRFLTAPEIAALKAQQEAQATAPATASVVKVEHETGHEYVSVSPGEACPDTPRTHMAPSSPDTPVTYDKRPQYLSKGALLELANDFGLNHDVEILRTDLANLVNDYIHAHESELIGKDKYKKLFGGRRHRAKWVLQCARYVIETSPSDSLDILDEVKAATDGISSRAATAYNNTLKPALRDVAHMANQQLGNLVNGDNSFTLGSTTGQSSRGKVNKAVVGTSSRSHPAANGLGGIEPANMTQLLSGTPARNLRNVGNAIATNAEQAAEVVVPVASRMNQVIKTGADQGLAVWEHTGRREATRLFRQAQAASCLHLQVCLVAELIIVCK
ncbi:hypothetical protein QFC19_006310 [Naganishia cerealis]|uniref:Uncharacterized protein n=1 Tax=Naganishia cerealis TaxID=610337 RepID=A0ACC2VGZ3_9TREE|nr:hypothetical protein QFC19_006310 [Naganishia cerealis]